MLEICGFYCVSFMVFSLNVLILVMYRGFLRISYILLYFVLYSKTLLLVTPYEMSYIWMFCGLCGLNEPWTHMQQEKIAVPARTLE